MKLAYILTQFPFFTETFVGREIQEVERSGHAVEVYSLKRFDAWESIHEDMREFQGRVHYSGLIGVEIIKSNWYWLRQSPRKYLSLLAVLLKGLTRNLPEAFKAIGCFPLVAHFAYVQSGAGIEHIHSHFARMGATAAYICAELTGKPFSFTVHAFDIFLGRDDPYLQEKLDKCKAVACISQYNINYIKEICPDTDEQKFLLVRCGIERNKVAQVKSERQGRGRRILSVGSLIEKKGHRYLVEAIARLVREGDGDLQCTIIGEGPDRPYLERLIRRHELEDRVELLGNQPQHVVQSHLDECDLFVLACINARDGDRDGIPVALMESMAKAKPTISTYVSGIPELICDQENGLLVPERNVPALGHAIHVLLDDEQRCTEYGQVAMQTILDDYTLEGNVSTLVRMFMG